MASAAAGQLADTYGLSNFVPVEWHYSGGLYTSEAATRYTYYGGGGVPFCMVDGQDKLVGAYPNNVPAQVSWYESYYNAHRTNPSPATITFLTKSYNNGTATVKVKLDLESNIAAGHVLHIILWEDHVSSLGTDWRMVERSLQTKNVTITNANASEEFTADFTLSSTWKLNDLGCTVILQEPTSKVIAQGNATKLDAGNAVTPSSLGKVRALFR